MRKHVGLRLALTALALTACSPPAEAPPQSDRPQARTEPVISTEDDERIGRGEAVAEAACATCHAIGAEGDSPHADAPPFRRLNQVTEFATVKARLAAGNITQHPDMPNWQFEQIDLDALVAYLETIQTTGAD